MFAWAHADVILLCFVTAFEAGDETLEPRVEAEVEEEFENAQGSESFELLTQSEYTSQETRMSWILYSSFASTTALFCSFCLNRSVERKSLRSGLKSSESMNMDSYRKSTVLDVAEY